MKILFFIDSFPAGGKERRLLELMKGLRKKQGIEFELVIMSNDVHYKEVFDLNIKIHFVIRKTKKDLSVFSQFYRLCKAFGPDIVHCWDSMTAIYLVPVSKLLHIKFVNGMVVDTPAKKNTGNKTWLRAKLTFPFSHIIIGNSEAGLNAYGAPKRKRICIYNGFNFDRIVNLTGKEHIRMELGIDTRFIIGMVASFSIFKDYKTYFDAAQLLLAKRKDITFLAIGDYTDSAESKRIISDEFKEYFRLLGTRSNVESFVNSMDICILATFTEGISNSILEYMSLAKPVIATDGGGTCEIVKDQQTGYLISVSNPEELAAKMEILLNNEVLCNKMGLAGKQRAVDFFSIDKMVNAFVTSYNKLIA
jgi:glycosyltransferase involved in cell wall biosynthesis